MNRFVDMKIQEKVKIYSAVIYMRRYTDTLDFEDTASKFGCSVDDAVSAYWEIEKENKENSKSKNILVNSITLRVYVWPSNFWCYSNELAKAKECYGDGYKELGLLIDSRYNTGYIDHKVEIYNLRNNLL